MDKINVGLYDKIMIENQKRTEKIWKSKTFLHKLSSNRWFGNGIHSFLSRIDAIGALTSFTVCDAYRYFVGQS